MIVMDAIALADALVESNHQVYFQLPDFLEKSGSFPETQFFSHRA